MVFYRYKFSVEQQPQKVFDYFLNRNYLKRFLEENEEEQVGIHTSNESLLMVQGEELEMIFMDKESIIIFQIKVLEVKQKALIKLRFQFVEAIDREEGDLDDDLEATNFLKKYLGQSYVYTIQLKPRKDKITIIETVTIKEVGILAKLFYKIGGFYYQLSHRKIYKEIRREIESL